ncbi:hypothetical protein [Nocardioides sp. AE5]|uniref:hypothetical protein n=1 Tax=Nocardioides sp. AE5 TaxID=2962573 RepID=UPI0028817FC6|nr:hypothetical protein [Nocardioides sp. AE5]MDT0201713.1 hypothetical protein [Nocardioides sp. AE5]
MQTDALIRTWLLEVLADGPATALEVARAVWSRHEDEIRDVGDLLFTWQLDLRRCAEALISGGDLAVLASGKWAAPDGSTPPTRRTWAEAEIAVAVERYLDALVDEHAGKAVHQRRLVSDLVGLTSHGEDRVHQLLCNITTVVGEHDIAPLTGFPPRSNVPVGVRPAVAQALERLRTH